VTFEFLGVKDESIEVARLDQCLAEAKPNLKNRQITKLLKADAVYVITSVLKSSKLNIAAKRSRNQALKLDAGELARLVGADGKELSRQWTRRLPRSITPARWSWHSGSRLSSCGSSMASMTASSVSVRRPPHCGQSIRSTAPLHRAGGPRPRRQIPP